MIIINIKIGRINEIKANQLNPSAGRAALITLVARKVLNSSAVSLAEAVPGVDAGVGVTGVPEAEDGGVSAGVANPGISMVSVPLTVVIRT